MARQSFIPGALASVEAGQRQAFCKNYNPAETSETIQIFARNFSSPQQLAQALAAAQQVNSGKHSRAKSVIALDFIGCQFLSEEVVLGLGRIFPNLLYVTIFDCLMFDYAWLRQQSLANHAFVDLPYGVTATFSTPSMPPQLDDSLCIAGQKGLASWRCPLPALSVHQAIVRDVDGKRGSMPNSNELILRHVLYMLNWSGYEDSLEHEELLSHVANRQGEGEKFCTLEELEDAFT
ncbi:hypothetical protein LTR27_006583 [Elasticomyces elasticus]|nr:hypothetical protein LTR27_006583 [Elasticomyces elasticus]